MIISCVLKRSLAFGPEHVEWLGRQVAKHYPDAVFKPFTDVPVDCPHERLEGKLPTWWAKMEAMRRMPVGTVLMLDLDTVLLRPFDVPDPPPGFAYMQTSPRNIDKVWGGLMISSPEFRAHVTDAFYADPYGFIDACGGCDQRYYVAHHRQWIKPLNTIRPDAVISYKMHYLQAGLSPENAFVMFHGLPRPWHVAEDFVPPLTPPESK